MQWNESILYHLLDKVRLHINVFSACMKYGMHLAFWLLQCETDVLPSKQRSSQICAEHMTSSKASVVDITAILYNLEYQKVHR